MTTLSSSKKLAKTPFIELISKNLKVGSKLTFDCSLYLQKNDKTVTWLKKGQEIKETHLEKLGQFKVENFLVEKQQANDLIHYLKTTGNAEAIQLVEKELLRIQQDLATTPTAVPPAQPVNVSKPSPPSPSPPLPSPSSKSQPANKPIEKMRAPKVDVEFLNPIIAATLQAFEFQAGIKVKVKAPLQRHLPAARQLTVDVASVLSLVSESIRGTIALCFPMSTFLAIYQKQTGQEAKKYISGMEDGAGELIQFIYTNSRKALATQGYPLEKAVPTLIQGYNLPLMHLISDPGFSIIFESECGPFQFEIGIKTAG